MSQESSAATLPKETAAPSSKHPYKGKNMELAHKLNRLACRWVVARSELRRRTGSLRQKGYYRVHEIALLIQITNQLYMLGFWTEYALLLIYRLCMRFLNFVYRETVRLGQALLLPLGRGLGYVLSELAAPFHRFYIGVCNINRERQQAQNREEKKDVFHHFFQGIIRYMPLVRRSAAYLVPLVALGVFVLTVNTMLGAGFILGVDVDGQTIGYVQTQQDFEGAKEEVSARIDSAKQNLIAKGSEVADQEWSMDISFHLATEATQAGNILTQADMTNAILRASSDQIRDGVAVYADGSLLGIVSKEDNDKLTKYLDWLMEEEIKGEWFQQLKNDPSLSNIKVEFVHDIEHGPEQEGVYFTSSFISYNELYEKLQDPTQYYKVQSWDTLGTIAEANDITIEQLCTLNGFDEFYEPVTGENLVVGQGEGVLAIQQTATINWQVPIPFETETRSNDSMSYGKTKTIQEGVSGVREYTATITYREGREVGRVISDDRVLREPVTAIVERGTKLPSGMVAQYGGGNWLWPVPNYTYVSRWMSSYHNGSDICAPYGVDVLACESGVVVTATSHWSFGNYVVIDHGNGWTTLYGHASKLYVTPGQAVTRGQVIMAIGSTGVSSGNHCHLEFRYNGALVSAQNIFGGAPPKG